MATLTLSDGTVFTGESFGASLVDARDDTFGSGEVVFNTGMVGYPESLTDPSYRGQILVFTYPLIGNYGVPSAEKNAWGFAKNFESESIHVRGVIVAQASEDYSHFTAVSSLHTWLEHHNIPGITGVDTRELTKKLREHGVMLGRIGQGTEGTKGTQGTQGTQGTEEGRDRRDVALQRLPIDIQDPNNSNLVAEVSCKEVITYEPDGAGDETPTVACFDCGIKNNILRSFLQRGVRVHRLPWDYDLAGSTLQYDAVFISNGPGDPKMCIATIDQVKKAMDANRLVFGICLGNQITALAAGGDTYKLKYGHRSANQPCTEEGTNRCIITSQNHGYAVDEKLPAGWKVWFRNANDGTVDGIQHESGRFFTVQFHPEATPGPEDANYLFDEFVGMMQEEMKSKAVVV
jgi:carbamoyl-phosphate synthase small subunit